MAWAGPAADEEEEKSRPLPEGEATGQEYVGQHARDDDSDVHQKLKRGGGGVSDGGAGVGDAASPGICLRRTSSSC